MQNEQKGCDERGVGQARSKEEEWGGGTSVHMTEQLDDRHWMSSFRVPKVHMHLADCIMLLQKPVCFCSLHSMHLRDRAIH